jgi:hypothetical protein
MIAACPTETDPFAYMPVDFTKLTAYQELLIFMLRNLGLKQYRRYNEGCYIQIISPPQDIIGDGVLRQYPTHAWEHVCDIKEIIQQCATKEDVFAQWKNMNSGNNLKSLAEYLSICNEIEFQPLIPNRHWHEFINGLYCTETTTFHPWGDAAISSDVVACNYHKVLFDTDIFQCANPMEVETPFFHQILMSQLEAKPSFNGESAEAYEMRKREANEVIEWVYVFLGRLLFGVGELDAWQIIPFFCGKAGTGKSTILKAAGWFFREEDVETLANNSQKDFGLETFLGKLMWRCSEVKRDFQLDQAQLQSMVSGESMCILRKHKTAINVTWTVPGIMAGNEVPTWRDNGGAVARRVVVIKCETNIEGRRDPQLENKIRLEMPNLLHKCAWAYTTTAARFRDKDIWGKRGLPSDYDEFDTTPAGLVKAWDDVEESKRLILPKYYHDTRQNLQGKTNLLQNFLTNSDVLVKVGNIVRENGKIVIDERNNRKGMPFDEFKTLANLWCDENANKERIEWKEVEMLVTVFEDKGNGICLYTKANIGKNNYGESVYEYKDQPLPAGKSWLWGIIARSQTNDEDDE